MQKVIFRSGDLDIHGTLVMPEVGAKFPAVIIFHGMTSSEASYIPLATKLAEHGIAGLAVTMRGHGESQGDFHKATVTEAINDAVAAYDFMAKQPAIDTSKIGLVGSSVGAILAAIATEQRQVKSLVLRAPAAYTNSMMNISMADTMTNEDRQFHEIQDLASTPAGQAIAAFNGNLLVVASEKDALIPPAITQGYIDLAAKANVRQLEIIKGAPHSLSGTPWKDSFDKLATNWFQQSL